MERVSVIVPVYRVEKWLTQCVKSILSQSHRALELLLIDDGSDDGSSEICKAFGAIDDRVRYFRQENRGVSAARNLGLRLASGEYVTFCDGDDFWLPGHLEALLRLARESGADVVSCNYRRVDEDGKALEVTELSGTELEDVLSGRTGWAVWARLFRLGFLRSAGIRFCESSAYGEDMGFVLACCLAGGRQAQIGDALCCYRLRPGSATARREDMLEGLNESALDLSRRYPREWSPQIWFAMVDTALRWLGTGQIPALIRGLTHREWFRAQAAALLRCAPDPEQRALLGFFLHTSPLVYRLEMRLLRLRRKPGIRGSL